MERNIKNWKPMQGLDRLPSHSTQPLDAPRTAPARGKRGNFKLESRPTYVVEGGSGSQPVAAGRDTSPPSGKRKNFKLPKASRYGVDGHEAPINDGYGLGGVGGKNG